MATITLMPVLCASLRDPLAGVIDKEGLEVSRLYQVDATTGQGMFLTPDTMHVYESVWRLARGKSFSGCTASGGSKLATGQAIRSIQPKR